MEKFDFENQLGVTDFGYLQDEFLADQESFFSKYQLQQEQQQQSISADDLFVDHHRYNLISPPLEACVEEIKRLDDVEAVKKKDVSFSLASLKLLNHHGNSFKRLREERIMEEKATSNEDHQKQSTEQILRIAGTRFIHSSSQQGNESHPFQWSFPVLSQEDAKDVELVELLLASAEKVGLRSFKSARRLLNLCNKYFSWGARNAVQRLVYYFREALRQKIDRETGIIVSKSSRGRNHEPFDLDKAMIVPDMAKIAFHRVLPFSQVEKFAGIQAIVERIGDARKVHVIDLRITNGVQWTVLMQALASRGDHPLELFKITAIGSANSENYFMDETGKWLSNFASTMNIPFSFKKIIVSQMSDLKQSLFEFDTNEAIAVYSSFGLSRMISQPTEIEALMRAIRGLKPCVMVVAEVEANHNSPSFVNRFTEALFFYGAFLDLIETLMKSEEANRLIVESMYTLEAIRSIVADEGRERKVRHVKIDVWRAFFQRFGMEEIEFSQSSIYQANLVINSFQCGHFCTIDVIGKCLFLSWKGTPLQSISLWNFL